MGKRATSDKDIERPKRKKKTQLLDWKIIDSIFVSDELDHIRWENSESLKLLDDEGISLDDVNIDRLTWLPFFEDEAKRKLLDAGFKKEILEDPQLLGKAVELLDDQGLQRSDLPACLRFCGYAEKAFTMNPEKKMFWVKPQVEAALRVLASLEELRGLLRTKQDIKIHLNTMELIVNFFRAGAVPYLAISEAEKVQHSRQTRESKKRLIHKAVANVFQQFPHLPKTLGAVWRNFDSANKDMVFFDHQTGDEYAVRTAKGKRGDIIIISSPGEKPIKYAKRSLQPFIDKLK